MLESFKEIYGKSPVGLLALLITWSLFLTVIYLNAKLVARRCCPFKKIPLCILPLQLVGDLFTGNFVDSVQTYGLLWLFAHRDGVH